MQWSLTTYMHCVTYAFHRCLLRCSLGRHNKESKEQLQPFFPAIFCSMLDCNLLFLHRFLIFSLQDCWHHILLAWCVSPFCSKPVSGVKPGKGSAKLLEISTWGPFYLRNTSLSWRQYCGCFSIEERRKRKEESTNCHINIFNPLFFPW